MCFKYRVSPPTPRTPGSSSPSTWISDIHQTNPLCARVHLFLCNGLVHCLAWEAGSLCECCGLWIVSNEGVLLLDRCWRSDSPVYCCIVSATLPCATCFGFVPLRICGTWFSMLWTTYSQHRALDLPLLSQIGHILVSSACSSILRFTQWNVSQCLSYEEQFVHPVAFWTFGLRWLSTSSTGTCVRNGSILGGIREISKRPRTQHGFMCTFVLYAKR